MKILVTSRSRTGSFIIRGEQLGAAIGARVEPRAMAVGGYDLVIMVKRKRASLLQTLRNAGARIVWDVVDAWPQPEGNTWNRARCMRWLDGELMDIAPLAVVAATQAMAADLSMFAGPILALPHHGRPGMPCNPIRETVQTVAYEGRDYYLGRWQQMVEEQCRRRGWQFVLNPPALADADIVVGFRDCPGYAARNWKSNVKLANAQCSGTPCVMNREAGYVETAVGGVAWADDETELGAAFDRLASWEERKRAQEALLASAPTLEKVSNNYKSWLAQLNS